MSWTESLGTWAESGKPATEEQIILAEARLRLRFSSEYREFLAVTNGMMANDFIIFFSTEEIVERNETHEIGTYFPGWVMIGDDGGGRGFLTPGNVELGPVFWLDMGSVLLEERDKLSDSLEKWLGERCPMPEDVA